MNNTDRERNITQYSFVEYRVKTWNECRKLLESINDWVFRGQSNSEWKLQTTLERAVTTNKIEKERIDEIEDRILKRFERRSSTYLSSRPDYSERLDWLSLIQHHGGPTKILDFTFSYFVALFFSIENANSDSALYCLNKELIFEAGWTKAKELGLKNKSDFGTRHYCNNALTNNLIMPMVVLGEPFILHERITRQQGLFAIMLDSTSSFEENLSKTLSDSTDSLQLNVIKDFDSNQEILRDECAMLKIIIPKELHDTIKRQLQLMNINYETLFPGFDGFTRSLYDEFIK